MLPAAVEKRGSPRVQMALDIALRRERGNPVGSRTIDVGSTGIRVASPRPLAVDELLDFDLSIAARHIQGRARVVREHPLNVYALRVERFAPGHAAALSAFVSAAC